MHRRSAISQLAAGLAGLSLGEMPSLNVATLLPGEPFSVTRENLAESSGTVTCAICQEMADALELTPAGPCLRCADRNPAIKVEPHSNPFWILSPQEIRRLEREIQRLAARLDRTNARFLKLGQQQIAEGSEVYDRAVEAGRDEWHALQRELHLLHLLRAASRQFGGE
jgi:hypothetical protein